MFSASKPVLLVYHTSVSKTEAIVTVVSVRGKIVLTTKNKKKFFNLPLWLGCTAEEVLHASVSVTFTGHWAALVCKGTQINHSPENCNFDSL